MIILTLVLIDIFKRDDFSFKKLSSTCGEFTIYGSIAYNNEKSSIYITNIDYCGDYEDTVYDNINCTLYEEYNGNVNKVSECESKRRVTLEEFLEGVSINVDDYSSSCKIYKDNNIYIEINASLGDNKSTVYKIPLTLEDNC